MTKADEMNFENLMGEMIEILKITPPTDKELNEMAKEFEVKQNFPTVFL